LVAVLLAVHRTERRRHCCWGSGSADGGTLASDRNDPAHLHWPAQVATRRGKPTSGRSQVQRLVRPLALRRSRA
jgi:hypothetical protein